MFKHLRVAQFFTLLVACLPFCPPSAFGQLVTGEYPHPSPMQATQSAAGLTAQNDREQVEITVCSDSVIHVTARPLSAPAAHETQPWLLPASESCPGATFQFNQNDTAATVITSPSFARYSMAPVKGAL